MKFNQMLDLERKRANKGLEMSANVAEIAKVTRVFIVVIEKDLNKHRINTKNDKCHKRSYLKRTKLKKALQQSTNFAKIENENFAFLKKKKLTSQQYYNKLSNRIKVKRNLLWSANFAKFAKVTRI